MYVLQIYRLSNDIGALKSHLQPLIGIPPAMMKVMIKGLAKDEMTLRKLGVAKGSKIMVVGSSINDVLQMSSTPKDIGNSNKKQQWNFRGAWYFGKFSLSKTHNLI